jgi:hypothetical protein
VAYRWIRRDAIESGHISIIAPALQATNRPGAPRKDGARPV